MWNRIADFWCRRMHRRTTWPMHGHYVCQQCWREFPVYWGTSAISANRRPAAESRVPLRSTAPAVQ